MTRFHIISNAHIDPVWLWDWREGLNEGIATCRSILGLMDEFPELKFTRGEASVYEHIERHAPDVFERIKAAIAEGRWEVAGGNYVQPDTNLPATEVLARQFHRGLGYFRRSLGARPVVAWAPDSFGHSAGWPEIYSAAGMKYFAFSRPFATDLALEKPAFWWEAQSGARVLAWRVPIGWYGSTRSEFPARLDAYRDEAGKWGLENVAVFMGLGNHGGGPSRAQIESVMRWREQNGGVSVVFSTLREFFAAISGEAARLPVFRGELNFALRGCYASAAPVKFAYRRAENALLLAERTVAAVDALEKIPGRAADATDLREAWDAVLFNTFHDVLPGTAIERALSHQRAWIGLARHHAQRACNTALNCLAERVDTRVPAAAGDRPAVSPVLLWNSHPVEFDGPVEFEVPLDYRPLDEYRDRPDAVPLAVRDAGGRALSFQSVAVENDFASGTPWRKRFVVRVKIPPCGWHVLTAGLDSAEKPARQPQVRSDLAAGAGGISNSCWSVRASAKTHSVIFARNKSGARDVALRVLSVDDPWGSWGGHDGEVEANHINETKAVWKIESREVLERGPERAALWVRLANGASWMELTVHLYRGDKAVVVRSRAFWAEKAARLKLEFSGGGMAEFEVPGGRVRREPCGDVPGGRWVRAGEGREAFVFASDALYCFDATAKTFGATVVRSAPYASLKGARPGVDSWRPHMDLGEHLFQFALAGGTADADALARWLEAPPAVLLTSSHGGPLARTGGVLRVDGGVRMLAFARAETRDGWLLRVQNTGAATASASVELLGLRVPLGRIARNQIRSFILQQDARRWNCTPVSAAEEPLPDKKRQ